jgi:plastocyanin
VRRAFQLGAGLVLALVILTCTHDRVTGPARPGGLAFTLDALLAGAPGQPTIPLDSLRITLRRPTETTFAYAKTVPVRGDTLAGDSVVLKLDVELQQNTEDFILDVTAYGANISWYALTATVQLTAGSTARPAAFVARYIGPGYNAKRVQVLPVDTSAIGGTTFPLRNVVFDSSNVPIPGVPVGYRLSDPTRGSIAQSYLTSSFTGSTTVRDSVWVIAETPTHLRDSTRIHVRPPAATLQKVSGDSQSGVIGGALLQPLVVRVRDGLGAPFKGLIVFWTVTSGTATLSSVSTATDDSGLASVTVTPASLGTIGVQAAAGGLTGSPVSFAATVLSGTIRQVIISPKVDTVARGATVQYTAVLKDSLGNTVGGAVTWSSTLTAIATVSGTGLATTLTGDSTRIIAAAGGYADTARLYVRALRSVIASPADTVVTAVNDSFLLTSTAKDNFGTSVASGFTTRYVSASPSVVTVNATTGRVKAVGAGNGVILVRDSVDAQLVVQGSATIHVNQVTVGVVNLQDTVQVGVGGRGQIVAHALDKNGFVIPGKTFGWSSRAPTIATVDQTGIVTGGATVGQQTYVADSVDGFKDTTLVMVVASPPPVIQWAFDSLSVGNGGNVSVALSLTKTSPTPLIVKLTSSDTLIARPQVKAVTFPAGTAGASVIINGLKAGRVSLAATDSSGSGYQPDTMVVTVVSTIEFREIGTFSQQPNFYLNQNETHKAQVFLSDPAPAGGLGVTFVYGKAGTSAFTPAPAVIPAGQLAADILLTGLAPGTDSVTPTSGGFVGKFSRVSVAANSLTFNRDYPYTNLLGVGQTAQPYVSITYGMDHNLVVAASLSSGIGTIQTPDTIRTGTNYAYLPVRATAPGKTAVTISAPGWVSATDTLIFTTPRLQALGSGNLIAGDPSKGSWTAYTEDSTGYGHPVGANLLVTALSRDPTVVAVDVTTGTITTGSSAIGVGNALRAQPGAGGLSTYIVLTAPGYTTDSFLVSVTRPTLTLGVGYPYDGRLGIGTLFQSAGYVQIPYVRPDTFTVTLGHSRPGVVRGPATVRIPANQTIVYFNLVGDTLGGDTLSVASAPGYVITGSPVVYQVDSIHVRPYSYPGLTNYTISPPYPVSVYAYDALNGQARPLVKSLRVSLASTNPATLTLDSAAVTIDSGQTYTFNHPDTLRFVGLDTLAGARILTTAPGSTPDSSNLIKVFPTPLSIQLGYPYTVGRGLRLQSNYVVVSAGAVPDTVKVALRRFDPTLDTLTRDTVVIPKGQNYSQPFEIWAKDSSRTDSIRATATGYVSAKINLTPEPVSLIQNGIPASRFTTDPPYRPFVYTGTRSRNILLPFAPVNVTVVSTDPNVMQIDSAVSVNGSGDTAVAVVDTSHNYASVRVKFVGSGTARLRYSAPGWLSDSTNLVTVTGPTLHLSIGTNQNLGVGQLFSPTPSQYVYVDNAVTSAPLVVQLLKSDSTLPAAQQAFTLSATTVTIPVGQTSSNTFEIQGNSIGAAVLAARATGYSQATANLSISQPKLVLSPSTVSLSVGQVSSIMTVYAEDQSGSVRYVAAPLTIGDTSASPSVANADSLVIHIPARQYYAQVGVRGFVKGATQIVFTAAGYVPDTLIVQVDTAQLTLNNPPNGLGAGQTAPSQLYVSVPYTAFDTIFVSLGSSDPAVLTVPTQVKIAKGANFAYIPVTGTGVNTANVTATASNVKAATPMPVRISTPRLLASMAVTVNAGQANFITVISRDSSGNTRNVAAQVTVTVASTNATHATFDSSTIRIPANGTQVQSRVTFDTAGTYIITASAPGWVNGVDTVTVNGAVVNIGDNFFQPVGGTQGGAVTIKAGQTVLWKNTGTVPHTSTSDTGVWNSGNLAAATGTYIRTFSAAGTFPYHCTIHGVAMAGTVVVTP